MLKKKSSAQSSIVKNFLCGDDYLVIVLAAAATLDGQ
jgi:hypothetical protein